MKNISWNISSETLPGKGVTQCLIKIEEVGKTAVHFGEVYFAFDTGAVRLIDEDKKTILDLSNTIFEWCPVQKIIQLLEVDHAADTTANSIYEKIDRLESMIREHLF